MNRHQFLARVHEIYQPRTYFEIGINDGRSLTLSRARTVAVDPNHLIKTELRCDLHVVKATSDDFFAREQPFEHFGDEKLDLAFIDGMHLFEYVLRDFIHAEKYADWSSVIVFDDQAPGTVEMAARKRISGMWTGDVYKIIAVLQRYRPDLRVSLMDTSPTGVMAVFGADPTNTVLSEKYDEIMETFLLKDPQDVPEELLTRAAAMDPEILLQAPFWSSLVAARGSEDSGYGRVQLLADIDKALADAPKPCLAEWLPDPSAGRDAEADNSVVSVGERSSLGNVAKEKRAKALPKPVAKASTAPARKRPPNDVFRKLARRLPFVRQIPGAATLARKLRAARAA